MTADFVIIGAGIIGLSVAKELKEKYPSSKIIILEKEPSIGLHSSGRNSGVLHSGIYYPKGSLKAKICAEGAQKMMEYCLENNLPIKKIGKVIVPTQINHDSQLDVLYERAKVNNAEVSLINEQELKEIEPAAKSASGRALFSPNSAIVNSQAILKHLENSLKEKNIDFIFNSKINQVNNSANTLIVNNSAISYGHLFNTAGLYADKVASNFEIHKRYTMLPFKGVYYKLNPHFKKSIRRLIYPVPDMNMPFLGIHLTPGMNGEIMVGPSAQPALSRENYKLWEGLKLTELMSITKNLFWQYILDKNHFRNFAHREIKVYLKSNFAKAASLLVPGIKAKDLLPSYKVGIRAQLLDLETNQLVMDFLIEQRGNSTHVLNAVSPAFTSAFTFAKQILERRLG